VISSRNEEAPARTAAEIAVAHSQYVVPVALSIDGGPLRGLYLSALRKSWRTV
jgi:hypothetical protein